MQLLADWLKECGRTLKKKNPVVSLVLIASEIHEKRMDVSSQKFQPASVEFDCISSRFVYGNLIKIKCTKTSAAKDLSVRFKGKYKPVCAQTLS